MNDSIFSRADEILKSNHTAALCIVVGTSGSTPRKAGAKMIVYPDGRSNGSIGGGSVEKEVVKKALEIMVSGKPEKLVFHLEDDLEMHCGGSMEVFIEPILPLQKLFIFGAGHVGKAVALFAKELDFLVTFFDPRQDVFKEDFFSSFRCISEDYFKAIDRAEFDNHTYIVIVTPKHELDEEILAQVARKPHAYLGMIGSLRKVEAIKKRFLGNNILNMVELEKIDMPIGIKFRAETPQEIAVSIVAKLIDIRNSFDSRNS